MFQDWKAGKVPPRNLWFPDNKSTAEAETVSSRLGDKGLLTESESETVNDVTPFDVLLHADFKNESVLHLVSWMNRFSSPLRASGS